MLKYREGEEQKEEDHGMGAQGYDEEGAVFGVTPSEEEE